MNELENIMKKITEMLLNEATDRTCIVQFLIQNGAEVSDEDLDTIIAIDEKRREIRDTDVPVQMSADGKSFFTLDIDDKMPVELKQTLVRIPTKAEARFLEDIYYQTQDRRIAIQGQIRSIKQEADSKSENEENNDNNMAFMQWYLTKMEAMEDNIKRALEAFSNSYYLSKWAKANIGIGPVISTVLAANLEMREGMHPGNWWSYAGLNNNNRPWLGREKAKAIIEEVIKQHENIISEECVAEIASRTKWKLSYLEGKAKTKRGWNKEALIKACSMIPYNKSLKVLMYKIGHSFRMAKNKPDSLYGRILREREAYEQEKNARGEYAEQAANILKSKNIGKSTVAYSYYSKGQLPPAHISQRSERYATKLFMSHLFEAAYWNTYGQPCPDPYIIGFDPEGHNDYIKPEVAYDSIARD